MRTLTNRMLCTDNFTRLINPRTFNEIEFKDLQKNVFIADIGLDGKGKFTMKHEQFKNNIPINTKKTLVINALSVNVQLLTDFQLYWLLCHDRSQRMVRFNS